jgi:hypothetical protein
MGRSVKRLKGSRGKEGLSPMPDRSLKSINAANGSGDGSPLVAVPIPTPPPGVRWRVEQQVPRLGWQFFGYARSEADKRALLTTIRNFNGRGRAEPVAILQRGSSGPAGAGARGPTSTVPVKPPSGPPRARLLLKQAAHWLFHADREAGRIDLTDDELRAVIHAAKQALEPRRSAFERAQREEPRAPIQGPHRRS